MSRLVREKRLNRKTPSKIQYSIPTIAIVQCAGSGETERVNERKCKDRRAEQGKTQQLTAAKVKLAERLALDSGFEHILSRLTSLHPS